jgi:predicted Zn-dependent protease with MMP-like domain
LEPDPTGLPAGSALIVVERGPNAGSRFLLDQPVTSVGRHPRSDILLDDVTDSRRHMELPWKKDDFHDHVARPQCRQLCKFRTAATKAPRRSRRYPSTDSGTMAEMDARSRPGLHDPFEEAIDDALDSLPADLRAAMSNVEIVVEGEPPDGQPLLGLYRGVPLPRRSSTYSGVLPDKISIFGAPITRLAAGDAVRLRRAVRHVVLHEIAHHFGISDERLIELDRY